ncbi:DUF4942 domain-containing protein [Burkholderia vietnamiensis]|uniref:DUF4942 domain-containing protein n=1 Tax=Burkholderia vietnamiensis (strain G4 / LMG 22486) TaxID=269482 RepID=A4JFR0_BURVG|nr:hypothetical protein Bcep1808_2111 [Burkholderia vietnamiensis G4]MCB4344873.1 DUF4942 domain-containing protein [Burkholderia vietnamiensis]
MSSISPSNELQPQTEFSQLLGQRAAINEKLIELQRVQGELRELVDQIPFIDYGHPDCVVAEWLRHEGDRMQKILEHRREDTAAREQGARCFGNTPAASRTEGRTAQLSMLPVDSCAWKFLFQRLGYDRLLDEQGRNELSAQLSAGEFLPFVEANVHATLGRLLEERDETLGLGVERVFRQLSRDYKSNKSGGFGRKLVVESAVNYDPRFGGRWSEGWRSGALDDLLHFMLLADGRRDDVRFSAWLQEHLGAGRLVIQHEYFLVKVFKKGTLHLTFQRMDLLDALNRLLGRRNPRAITAEN